MTSFATRLKELRIEKGLTQKQASLAVGLSPNAFANYEIGLREPSFDTLIRICRLFGVSADYLLGIEDLFTVHLREYNNLGGDLK